MKKTLLFAFALIALILTACASQPAQEQTLTVMTHSSFAIGAETVQKFESVHGVKVSFLQSGDAGAMLNQAILTKESPLADVLFGVDNAFLSRALDAEIFEPYASPLLKEIPAALQLDRLNRALPVDFGDVCINYDKKYFAEKSLPVPQSFEDLLKPEYANLLAVENPATSSPGLAFLIATRVHFGEKYLDYWKNLKANGVVVADGWETAYYTHFSASSGKGAQPMVVSYASSPAAEVYFAAEPLEEAPTGSILAPGMCFRQIEFAGVLKNARNPALARKFVDFMLSEEFQEDMPLNMFVYPANKNAALPEVFTRYAQFAPKPAQISYEEIAANRDAWIEAWTEATK